MDTTKLTALELAGKIPYNKQEKRDGIRKYGQKSGPEGVFFLFLAFAPQPAAAA